MARRRLICFRFPQSNRPSAALLTGIEPLLGSRIVNVTGPLTGQLEFDVVGSGLTLSLNGTGLVSTTDASLATGLVGMRGRNAAFANFEVQ